MKGLLPMYKGYQAKVEFSVEDSLLVGEVIGVADYLSFHAESVREVEDMFHQCIDGYLAFCREAGKTPEKAYRGSFNVRITPELHRKADAAAAERGISLNQLVARALEHEISGDFTTTVSFLLPQKYISHFADDAQGLYFPFYEPTQKEVGKWTAPPA